MATGTIESNNRKTGALRKFHVVVVQRHSNVQKSVMLVQSCCFANLNVLPFFAFLVIIAVIVAQALLRLCHLFPENKRTAIVSLLCRRIFWGLEKPASLFTHAETFTHPLPKKMPPFCAKQQLIHHVLC